MEKEKKVINILIVFFISHKSDVKSFLKWILNQCRTALVNMTQQKIVILKYSQSTENGAPSSHIHGGVCLLNSW